MRDTFRLFFPAYRKAGITLCCDIDVSHNKLDVWYQNNLGELFHMQGGNKNLGFAKIKERTGRGLVTERLENGKLNYQRFYRPIKCEDIQTTSPKKLNH